MWRAALCSVLGLFVTAVMSVTTDVALAQMGAPPSAGPPSGSVVEGGSTRDGEQGDPRRSGSGESPDKKEPTDKKDAADKDKDADEAGGPKPLKRPDTPPRIPDPREFDVSPDENGLVQFNFYGQAWPDVLQWLARISNHSLDWQELPGDYVNVTTSRSYSAAETRDLFNRLLLDRGYTMVEQGRVLTVAKISKLDPSLLQRVDDESELMDLPPHSFVKITFKLPDELPADKAATDIKPLLSTHAKVSPLLATNRILVIDAVANLRSVSRLVNAEHAAAVGHTVPKEFLIRYARAGQVADQVMILLGLDPSSRRTPQELQVEQQRLQLFQQMQQKGKDITKYLRKGDSPAVYLAVNDRTNSILVNAPAAEMRVIERGIEQLDVPSASSSGAMAGSLSMEKYQLATIAPQSIVTALESIGDLDPRTRLETDTDAKIVFAHATPRDHEKISAMIDRLDGSGCELAVIWLRRLPADAVAISLRNLLVGKEEKESSSGRSMFYYSSRRDSGQEKPKSEFRVDADVEQNRLLLWANESELEEVQKFLEKLGEIPGRSGNPHTVRFLDRRSPEDLSRTLEQLREIWQGPNELQIDVPPVDNPPSANDEVKKVPAGKKPSSSDSRVTMHTARTSVQTAGFTATSLMAQSPGDDPGTRSGEQQISEPPASPRQSPGADAPPVTISTTRDGRIVLQSDDPTALDKIEDAIASLTPPAPDFKVFYLENASASMVTLNLEEYFAREADFDTQDNWMRAYYGFDFKANSNQEGGLGQKRKIRFIYDFDTNSILVADASPKQMQVVETLIELYDVPPSEDSISARRFRMFQLEYAKADDVARIVKEVFRDLLSSKDKDFDGRPTEKEQQSQSRDYYRIFSGGGDTEDAKPKKVRASFEGALSVGVDPNSNSVIISAQEEWMDTVADMIEFLDQNAAPKTTVAVHKIPASVNASTLNQALGDIIQQDWVGIRRARGKPASPAKKADAAPPKPDAQ